MSEIRLRPQVGQFWKHRKEATYKVLGITSSAVPVSASAEPINGSKDYKITVQLHRGTPDGQVRGQLEIKTDDPEQQVVNVLELAVRLQKALGALHPMARGAIIRTLPPRPTPLRSTAPSPITR